MSKFLDWYALHNTLIIQSLAALIALLIIVFIFRLFFADTEEVAAAQGLKNTTYTQLEEKLNQLLEQQTQMKVSLRAATEPSVDQAEQAEMMATLSGDPEAAAAANAAAAIARKGSPEQMAEMGRLRVELTSLKESLKRKEAEIVVVKGQVAESTDPTTQTSRLSELSQKLSDYEKQIDQLKTRLSDYEIIAEDIADLQKYRKENQELKNQLSGASLSVETPATSDAVTVTPVEEAIHTEEVFAVDDDTDMPEPSELPAEIATAEALEVSKDVALKDKILLDEFEKNFSRDED